jgi:hypothetical protein
MPTVGQQLAGLGWKTGLGWLSVWAAQLTGLLGPVLEPALCRGVQGLWQAGPPGTPLTRRDCRKVQGLLSSSYFEPPLLVPARLPTWSPAHPPGLPARQAPTLQINS